METKKRRPAHFEVTEYSPAFLENVTWKLEVSGSGVTARRHVDGVVVSIEWRTLIGAALYYGHTSHSTNGKRKAVER